MALNAFKNGVTMLDEVQLNSLISLQNFVLIYTGSQVDAKTGTGTAEFDCASNDHAIRFTAVDITEISRVEFELIKHGEGADLVVEVRDGFNPDGTADGTLVSKRVLPKEFIPATRSYWSIPLDATGLTAGNTYWLIVRGAGDATNHFHLHGETAQDADYPAYYRAVGGSGAWTAENAIHFKVFAKESGDLLHGIWGNNGVTWIEYDGELISKVYRYLPPSDGPGDGVRDILTYTWSGEYLKRGDV